MVKVRVLPVFAVLLGLCNGLFGCALPTPDPRTADVVVVNTELVRPTYAAASWWNVATHGDVSLRMVAACSPGHWCTSVEFASMPGSTIGQCVSDWTLGHGRSRIWVDVTVSEPGNLETVIAHEIGHSLGLKHVQNDPVDLMRPTVTKFLCIGQKTQSNYAEIYGANDFFTVCGPGNGADFSFLANHR